MSLREKVTESIMKYTYMPDEKADKSRKFYFKTYEDNLYCPLGEAALKAYDTGNGGETKPTVKNYKGKVVHSPAKMASVVSSSALTFNLLGNDSITITSGDVLPHGIYDVQYEKQMFTINQGSNPANLDAFLSNNDKKTAVFCEMKYLEWLGTPGVLKKAYLEEKNYFMQDKAAVECSIKAYDAFIDVIDKLKEDISTDNKTYRSKFSRYDAWQMLKHLLAIYNYTSFVTKASVDSFASIPSMAGEYNKIILLNVVNEFPAGKVEDITSREKYEMAMVTEREEANKFIETIRNSEIPNLFKNNCKASIDVQYISAEKFADTIEMNKEKREYLKRYF